MLPPPLSAVVIATLVALGYGVVAWTGIGAATNAHSQDLLWPDGTADSRVVVVTIDDRSIEKVGEWPWSRDTQADLVNALVGAGVTAIGYDILLPEVVGGGDSLVRAVRRVPTVVVSGFSTAVRGHRQVLSASGEVSPSRGVSSESAAVGHAVMTADSDGVTRTVPLVVEGPDGQLVGSLAFRTVDVADGAADQIYVRPHGVKSGDLSVPTEDGATLRVRWATGFGTSGPNLVSAADVLDGAADRSTLKGATVFVGVTAVALGDRHVTPLYPGVATPGVVIQAEVASTIMQGAWMIPIPVWWSMLILLFAGFGLAWAGSSWKIRWVTVVTVAAVATYLEAAVITFGLLGWLADLVRGPIAMLAAVVGAVTVRLVAEQRARQQAVSLFRRYVPERVAIELLRTGRAKEAAAGERVTVGLLFCDLRGFTPLAAQLEPGQVRQILERYYEFACAEIFERGGTVMQFVGDEVFAVFGAPEPVGDPAEAARETGLALQARASGLTEQLEAAGLPPVAFGIGVHVGDVVAAHVGPEHRRQYAVIGDPVNVGSRLCGIALAGEVVISEVAAGDLVVDLELADLKGVAESVALIRIAERQDERSTPKMN